MTDLAALRDRWLAAWPAAQRAWSELLRLSDPRFCLTKADEKREQLSGSFAMIRLVDQAVVVSLRQVAELGLAEHALAVLAHEVGHHVLAPADLRDNARLLARIRNGLPGKEPLQGLVSNLYTDLLINDRLQQSVGVDLAAVYRVLASPGDDLWTLYMRIYEHLWRLPAGTLCRGVVSPTLDLDAQLGARLVRSYGADWMRGGGRFAALVFSYLPEPSQDLARVVGPWLDAADAGAGGDVPDGMAACEDDEGDAIHPIEDPELSGTEGEDTPKDGARVTRGGRKQYRPPSGYVDLMKSLGVKATEKELVMRYYRELALPHLVPFPARVVPRSTDPLPEGLELWDVGSPLQEVDWIESAARSPVVIPGVSAMRRVEGTSPGQGRDVEVVDCYVGIDCSGSMGNPAATLSYPVVAGAIIALSALRAGARVMVCLSGEPGEHAETDGFVRDPRAVLRTITDYLGTGYAFGIVRLRETFLDAPPPLRPVHVLVVSDSDLFTMMGEVKDGWNLMGAAARAARGGATAVLQIPVDHMKKEQGRLRDQGWRVDCVDSQEQLVAFARAFARERWGERR